MNLRVGSSLAALGGRLVDVVELRVTCLGVRAEGVSVGVVRVGHCDGAQGGELAFAM